MVVSCGEEFAILADMQEDELYREQEGEIIGDILLTGIIYRITDTDIEYLLIRPRLGEDSKEEWSVPGGNMTPRDVVRVPKISFSDHTQNKVELIIAMHIQMTLGIQVTDIEYLFDPTAIKTVDIPVMGYYARYTGGIVPENLNIEHCWITYAQLTEIKMPEETVREICALNHVFQERAMYGDMERKLELLQKEVDELKSQQRF